MVFAMVTSLIANSLDEKVSPIIIDSVEVVVVVVVVVVGGVGVGEGASECNAPARKGALTLAEDQDDRSTDGELMMIYKSLYFHCMAN